MSIKLLHASMGGTDKQTLPLITLRTTAMGNPFPHNALEATPTGFSCTMKNRGLGPALNMSAFLEARRDTVSDKVFERRDCDLKTTFLPVDGETSLTVPSAFMFQPFVVEYASAMNTVYETRLEPGDPIIQSNRMLRCEYMKLADMTFEDDSTSE